MYSPPAPTNVLPPTISPSPTMTDCALEAHRAGLRRMLETGKHADLVLRCTEDGKEFRVHKAIVCGQSKFFEKACEPGNFKEAKDNAINLTIGDSSTIHLLLVYIYTAQYENHSEDILSSHVNVYVAADFYDIPILNMLAAKEFSDCLSRLSVSSNFIDFVNATEAIFNNVPSPDRVLREHVLEFVEHRLRKLLVDGEAKITAFTELMDRVPELAKELVVRFVVGAEKSKVAPYSVKGGDRSGDHRMKILAVCPQCDHLVCWKADDIIECCECGHVFQ
ncbi:hypothetical protein FKW77_000815 [Venturia effusa]|uniref:BTB domain-containing protein n=1 Tax=Venturia effusa TaxID=50376 RepID=A0A517L2P1_9PEZI|nr:hypothetical protein FKW77_000815 [Venturia effusa]